MKNVIFKVLVLLCVKMGATFWCSQLHAQPIHEYFYDNNLNGTAGAPTLIEIFACGGGPGAFGTQTINTSSGFCSTVDAFCFTQGGGLSYLNPNYITSNYTINLLFKFNTYGGWSRIIDFSNSTNDAGIYLLGNCLNFYPNGNVGTCPYFVPNTYYLFTFVRTGFNNIISVYVDGNLFGTYNDAGNLYRPTTSNVPIKFFRDDNVVPCEVKSGCVKYTSITSSALNPLQVDSLWLTICNTIVLPIELLSFTGTCNHLHTVLNWATAAQTDNDYFWVEKSDDAAHWLEIGKIKGLAEGTSSKNYFFTDTLVQQGTFYYRLKEKDISGKYNYSDIISVEDCVEKSVQALTIYPNPTASNINLALYSTINDNIRIEIFDTNGKLVQIPQNIAVKMGANLFELPQKLASGFYIVKIMGTERTFTQKLMVNE